MAERASEAAMPANRGLERARKSRLSLGEKRIRFQSVRHPLAQVTADVSHCQIAVTVDRKCLAGYFLINSRPGVSTSDYPPLTSSSAATRPFEVRTGASAGRNHV